MLFGAFHWAENALWPHFQTFEFFSKIKKRWNLKLWFLKTVHQRVSWGKIWAMCQNSRSREILNALRQELLFLWRSARDKTLQRKTADTLTRELWHTVRALIGLFHMIRLENRLGIRISCLISLLCQSGNPPSLHPTLSLWGNMISHFWVTRCLCFKTSLKWMKVFHGPSFCTWPSYEMSLVRIKMNTFLYEWFRTDSSRLT